MHDLCVQLVSSESEAQSSLLTPREVAAALGVSGETVRRWVRSGELDAVLVGHRVRIERTAVDNFVRPAGPESRP